MFRIVRGKQHPRWPEPLILPHHSKTNGFLEARLHIAAKIKNEHTSDHASAANPETLLGNAAYQHGHFNRSVPFEKGATLFLSTEIRRHPGFIPWKMVPF